MSLEEMVVIRIATALVQNKNVFETGHQLINSILNTKYVEAKDKGISFRFIIDDLSKLMMSDRDCIVILSNKDENEFYAVVIIPLQTTPIA